MAKLLEELKSSNAELEQFARITSHDLQEPLNIVTSNLQSFERQYKGGLNPDASGIIDIVSYGARRMQSMIDFIIQYSRINTRGGIFEMSDCNGIINSALSDLKGAIDESGAMITYDPMPVVFCDPPQLVRTFANLLGNSIKFKGTEPPRIHIRVEKRETEWVFSVKDNGIGFDKGQATHLFELFRRLHGEKYPGTGMGLAMCKKIVERHGGRIWAESVPWMGTTFYFTIPAIEGDCYKNK